MATKSSATPYDEPAPAYQLNTIRVRIKGLHHVAGDEFELQGVRTVQVELNGLHEQLTGPLGEIEARRLVDDVYEMVQERSMVLDLAKRCTITEYRS